LLPPKRNNLKTAKTFIALLFSFVLVAGQFSFAAPSPTAKQHQSACCGKPCCKKGSCCAKPADSKSMPLPIVPTQTISQTDWQLAASVAQHVISTIAPTQPAAFLSQFVLPDLTAVPLYERHCSFLI
jgi:hypothetical protein